ncbi:MAG TPA: hypothetical protein ENJ64_07325 [Thiotrichales bacterium]|nr:hypothetical protein [Thiotrichales bacterium]
MPPARQLVRQPTRHGPVEVWQQQSLRWLTLEGIEQTRIDLAQPKQLASALSRALLTALLFVEPPQRLLLAGLGGGAIARYLHAIDPAIHGDAVEICTSIATLAQEYFEFPSRNWRLTVEDIRRWCGDGYNWIISDIAEGALSPAWLTDEAMLRQYRQQLSADGVLVMNLLPADAAHFSRMLMTLRQVFERRTLCLTLPDFKNIIVLAFKQAPRFHRIDELKQRLPLLAAHWQLDFSAELAQLQQDNPVGSGVF